MVGMLGATFAPHPFGFAVFVKLFFPNGNAGLYLIDGETAGGKNFLAMFADRSYPDSDVAQFQGTDSMNGSQFTNRVLATGLLNDAKTLLQGQLFVGLVAETEHAPTLVPIPNPTLE